MQYLGVSCQSTTRNSRSSARRPASTFMTLSCMSAKLLSILPVVLAPLVRVLWDQRRATIWHTWPQLRIIRSNT